MDTTILQLSQEELLFALRVVGAHRLPGMGGAGLDQADAITIERLTAAGARSLLARGLLTPGNDGKLIIDRGIYTLVAICTHPEQMVSLSAKTSQRMLEQIFFYRVQEMAITHTPQMYGVHRFELAPDSDMGAGAAARLLGELGDCGGATPPCAVAQAILANAEDLAVQERNKAVALLGANGFADAEASEFVDTLADPTLSLTVQFVYQLLPEAEQKVLKLVSGSGGCWLVTGHRIDEDILNVQRISAGAARELVRTYFEPLRLRSTPSS